MRRPGFRSAAALIAVCLLGLAPGTSASAAVSQGINETIAVPGETPSGFVSVDGQTVAVPGARDVSINIKANAVVGDLVTLGTTGANCARLDRTLRLTLDAHAVGAVTVKYTTVDPVTNVGTPESKTIPLEAGQSGASPVIGLCVR